MVSDMVAFMMTDHPTGITVERLEALPWPGPVVFAAACAQRLAGVYRRHVEHTGVGDADRVQAALTALWGTLTGGAERGDLGALADECEALVPETHDEPSITGERAEDEVAAIVYALRCAAEHDPREAMASAGRVDAAINWLAQDGMGFDSNRPGELQRLGEHPMVRAELTRQNRDLTELEAARSPDQLPEVARRLRERAESERIFSDHVLGR